MSFPVDNIGSRPVQLDPVNDPNTHTVEDNEVASVEYHGDDGKIEMHPSWRNTSLAGAMDGNTLDLSKVTPEMLKELGATNTNILMDSYLAGREIHITTVGGDGSRSGGEVSAATALAMQMWGSGDSEAFAKIFAAGPSEILPYLTGNGSRVLTAENIALIMQEMQDSAQSAGGETQYDPSELDALGSLVQIYLDRNAGDDPQAVGQAVQQLIDEIAASGMEFTPENAGVLNGALVAGMLKHFDAIEASTETRNAIIGGVLDAIGGTAGAFGPWGAAASVGIGALKNIYSAVDKPENNEEVASRMQGAIQLDWLQNPPEGWSREDVLAAVTWVETTILNNGQR